jgi:colanic acid/amylovoran biosynthesis glycosyltransferase
MASFGRFIYVLALHPDDPGEEFFEPEIDALRTMGVEVVVVPLRPVSRRQQHGTLVEGLWSVRVLWGAMAALARRPLRTARAVARAMSPTRPGKSLRNLLVMPKALWLSRRITAADVVVAAWLTTPATAAWVAADLAGARWLSNAHRRDILECVPLDRKVRDASLIRAISDSSRERLVELSGAPRSRVHVIHLGLRTPESPTWRQRSRDSACVACIASLIPLKNHGVLIHALAKTSLDATLMLIGAGPAEAELHDLARELGVANRVRFTGQLSHDAVLDLMRSGEIDLVTLASTTEGIPVSLMEALAHGIPVVASDVGGVGELVDPAGGVLVADPFDAEAFANAWSQLLASWTTESSRAAHAFVRSEFSADSSARALLQCLSDAAASRGDGA